VELFGVAEREVALLSRRLNRHLLAGRAGSPQVVRFREGVWPSEMTALAALSQTGRAGPDALRQARRQRRLPGRRRAERVIGTQIGTGSRRISRNHWTSRSTTPAEIGACGIDRTGWPRSIAPALRAAIGEEPASQRMLRPAPTSRNAI
jgi:hypothetical protein